MKRTPTTSTPHFADTAMWILPACDGKDCSRTSRAQTDKVQVRHSARSFGHGVLQGALIIAPFQLRAFKGINELLRVTRGRF